MEYKWYSIGIMLVIISFLGFIVENVWLAITKHFIDNRNMTLPFLLGYGVIVIGMFLILGTPDNLIILGRHNIDLPEIERTVLYFILSMLIVSVGEIILGILVEKICGVEYWNYSWIPFHITKYTSIPTSLAFGFLITIFMGRFFDPIMTMILEINEQRAKTIALSMILALSIDFVKSFKKMYKTREHNIRWKIDLNTLRLKHRG